MATPSYGTPAYGGYGGPAEIQSLKSLLGATRVVALIFLILWIVVAAVEFLLFFFAGGLFLVFFIVTILVWFEAKEIEDLVDRGQFLAGKEKTLLWAIVGILFGGFIPGLLLLLAYFKFDPVINWQRAQMGPSMAAPPYPAYSAPPSPVTPSAPTMPTAAAPPPSLSSAPIASAPPMPSAPATPPSSTCPRCGRQIVWVAQYGRWYCYGEQTYL